MQSNVAILIASAVVVGLGITLFFRRRAVRQAKDTHILKSSIEKELHLPPTLHPVIDPNTCIGSLSCIKVCPEGDILGIVDGKASLIVAANCIGHSRCELECPVGAIKLVFGTSERGLDLPEVDEFFETNRAGVHIIGELGGMGLIKNAVRQGMQLGRRYKAILKPGTPAGQVHAVIVGAGPSGIAAALTMQEAGLSFRLVDQGATLGGTIANYPRQKLVMTETVDLPFYGKFGRPLISKEDLMEMFATALKKADIKIQHNVKVSGIDGEDGKFEVVTETERIKCQKVVLAIGRMGTPRKLEVPGEELPKVTYLLLHPEQYAGKKVLVVGGGDSALEIAQMVSAQQGAEVSISYRAPAFGRAKQRNKDNIERLIKDGQVKAIMSSTVQSIHPDKVVLDVNGAKTEIANDYVVVNVGGVLPTDFLKALGVSIQRHLGQVIEKAKKKQVSSTSRVITDESKEERVRIRLGTALTILGVAILAGLWYVGRHYYWLPPAQRLYSPLHNSLKPGGMWGHGVGVAATIVMLSNFLLPLRKHWRRLKGRKPIKDWMTFHVFVGIMSPLVILFHSAFGSNNMVATLCYSSLICVVGTGLVGRFFFGLIPIAGDHYLEMTELRSRMEQLRASLNPLLEHVRKPREIHWLLRTATSTPPEGVGFFRTLATFPFELIRVRLSLVHCRSLFAERHEYHEFSTAITRLLRLKRQASVYRTAKKVMNYWRGFHVVLAVFLLLVIAIHIATAWYMGYRWLFAR
jgi:thioredoxin reductase/NAD-dependent dihydropyrimidine dehydrogenase PreA subunit